MATIYDATGQVINNRAAIDNGWSLLLPDDYNKSIIVDGVTPKASAAEALFAGGVRPGEEIIGSQPIQSAVTPQATTSAAPVSAAPAAQAQAAPVAKAPTSAPAEAPKPRFGRTAKALGATALAGSLAAYLALRRQPEAELGGAQTVKTANCKGGRSMLTIAQMVKYAADEEAAKSEGGGEGGDKKKGAVDKVKDTAKKGADAVKSTASKGYEAAKGAAGAVGKAVGSAAGAVGKAVAPVTAEAGRQLEGFKAGVGYTMDDAAARLGGGRVSRFLHDTAGGLIPMHTGTQAQFRASLPVAGRHPILAALAAAAGLGGAGYGAYRLAGGGGAPAEKISSVRRPGLQKMAMLQVLARAHQIRMGK